VAKQRSFQAKDEIVWELTEIRIGTPGRVGGVILDGTFSRGQAKNPEM